MCLFLFVITGFLVFWFMSSSGIGATQSDAQRHFVSISLGDHVLFVSYAEGLICGKVGGNNIVCAGWRGFVRK